MMDIAKEEFINLFQSTYDRVSKQARSKRFVLRDFQLALKPLVESWKPSAKLQEYENVDWHEVMVQLAREFWRKPMLFYAEVPRKEYLENIMIAESIVMDIIYRHMVDEPSTIDDSEEPSDTDEELLADEEMPSVEAVVQQPLVQPMAQPIAQPMTQPMEHQIAQPIAQPVEHQIAPSAMAVAQIARHPVVETKQCAPVAVAKRGDEELMVAVCKSFSDTDDSSSASDDEPVKKIPYIAPKHVDDDDVDIPDFDSTQETRQDNKHAKAMQKATAMAVPKSATLTSSKDYLKYYPTYKSTNMYLKRLHKKT